MPIASLCRFSCRHPRVVFLLVALNLSALPAGALADSPVIAPQATLTIQPDHGACDQAVEFTGSGFVPGATVLLRPLHSASGHPYPDGPVYEVTPDQDGAFSVRANPCPTGTAASDGMLIFWSAEPPGRPYFTADGPFGLAGYTIFDLTASRFFSETGHSIVGSSGMPGNREAACRSSVSR